jgi:hypothetical protein
MSNSAPSYQEMLTHVDEKAGTVGRDIVPAVVSEIPDEIRQLVAEAMERRLLGLCDDRGLAESLLGIARQASAPGPVVQFNAGAVAPDYGRRVGFPRPDLEAEITLLRAENARLSAVEDAVLNLMRVKRQKFGVGVGLAEKKRALTSAWLRLQSTLAAPAEGGEA